MSREDTPPGIEERFAIDAFPAIAAVEHLGAAAYAAGRSLGASPDEDEVTAQAIWDMPWRGGEQGGGQ